MVTACQRSRAQELKNHSSPWEPATYGRVWLMTASTVVRQIDNPALSHVKLQIKFISMLWR